MNGMTKRLVTTAGSVLLGLIAGATLAIDSQPKAKPKPAVVAPANEPAAPLSAAIRELDWEDLIPPEAAARLPSNPGPMHDYLGEGGLAAQQVMDFSVVKSLDGSNVKLPGFIVPLEVSKNGLVTEFFLVPYVGACIHVPPPPPNQLVYVKNEKGLALESIWEAYWITGKLSITNRSTRLGAAAYQIAADKVEIYKF
jgi:hypothetical protein